MLLDVQPTVALAFAAGLVSFLSPCVFPLMPAYLAFLGGRAAGAAPVAAPALESGSAPGVAPVLTSPRVSLLTSGAAFVVGFSLVFVAFYYILAAVEVPFVARYHHWLSVAAGVVLVVLALHVLGVFRIAPLLREVRIPHPARGGGVGPALVLGMTFAAGWTPCIGPLLGAVLQIAALQHSFGGLPYMLLYCAGLGVPFLVVAALTDRLQGPIRALNRHLRLVNVIAGCLLLAFGALLIADRFTFFSQLSPQSPFDL